MKIIGQSATILPERENIIEQLEERGRICYQSQDKITPGSAKKFVEGIYSKGHWSVLEMARRCYTRPSPLGNPIGLKFITSTYDMLSGSIRAFLEAVDGDEKEETFQYLLGVHNDIEPVPMPQADWHHTFVCVKFVTNRAMSHELVRHRNCSFLQESQRYVRYEDEVCFIRPWDFSTWQNNLTESFYDSCSVSEYWYKRRLKAGQKPQQARGSLNNDAKTELLVYCSLAQWLHIFFMRCSPAADPQMRALMAPLLEEFRAKWPGMFDELKPSVAGE